VNFNKDNDGEEMKPKAPAAKSRTREAHALGISDELIRSQLDADEQILWSANPMGGRIVRRGIPPFLSAVGCTIFAIFLVFTSLHGSSEAGASRDYVGAILGGFFVVASFAACIAFSPYALRMRAKRIAYLITNRRAIVWEQRRWRGLKLDSYRAEQLGSMKSKILGETCGDLVFEKRVEYHFNGNNIRFVYNGFIGLENVREAEELIRHTLLSK
jgi:hypothetical protein